MPKLNLPITIRGRPVKPVSLVLMNTMLLLGIVAIADAGVLGDSAWSDALGALAFCVAGTFMVSWLSNSQVISEWALIGAFFIWGFRAWTLILLQGWHAFGAEGVYLSFLWVLLAGGSWLLERSDDSVTRSWRGELWTRRSSQH